MDETKNILGVELKENEKVSEETVNELSNGRGEDNE